jgi:hypothetical protein
VMPSLDAWASGAHIHQGAVIGAEVGTRAQPVDVGKVSEDLQLGREPTIPSKTRGLHLGALRGESPVCLLGRKGGAKGA